MERPRSYLNAVNAGELFNDEEYRRFQPTCIVKPGELLEARTRIEKALPNVKFEDLLEGKVTKTMSNGTVKVIYVQPHYSWADAKAKELMAYEVSSFIRQTIGETVKPVDWKKRK